MDLTSIRQEYMHATLDEKDAARDPFTQFDRWFGEAVRAQMPLVNAMTLSTVSAAGRPSSRIVLLKGADARGFVFYTNYTSRKGRELDQRPVASLLFHWTELERQVRIEGAVERGSDDEADAYFDSRPLGSRHAAIASPQSEVVADRAALEQLFIDAQSSGAQNPRRPPHWGGYRVIPDAIEFWQGRANRLHDRVLYTRENGGWKLGRLAP